MVGGLGWGKGVARESDSPDAGRRGGGRSLAGVDAGGGGDDGGGAGGAVVHAEQEQPLAMGTEERERVLEEALEASFAEWP